MVDTSSVNAASLPFGWLPKLNLVAFRVDDPAELSVLGVVCLLQNVAALAAQCRKETVQIRYPIVDHEGRLARSELITLGTAHRPDRRTCLGIAFFIGPAKRRASPVLHVDAQVLLVPGAQCNSVPGLEEDSP